MHKRGCMHKRVRYQGYPLLIFFLLVSYLAFTAFLSGCGNPTGGGAGGGATAAQAHIEFTNPYNNETGIFINCNRKIIVKFTTDMDPASLTGEGFGLFQGATPVPGTSEYNSYLKCFIFSPSVTLETETLYSAIISKEAKTISGAPLGLNYIWSFTTGLASDSTAPTFLACDPANNETNISTNKALTLTFSKPIDPDSLSSKNLYLFQIGGTTVEGNSEYHSTNVIFTPKQRLIPGATYKGYIKGKPNGVNDLTGIPLQSDLVISFEVADTVLKQQSVSLCSALTYAVLAGSFIHNTDGTLITGDVGTSPGGDLSGFTTGTPTGDGVVIGSTDIANEKAGAAAIDSELAYMNIVGRTGGTALPAYISNRTLKPGGLYNAPGNVELSGVVTLDGAGQSDAVFIFRIGGSLTVDPGCKIMLVNGGDADDTTWMVNVNTIIGANSVFKGSVIGGIR